MPNRLGFTNILVPSVTGVKLHGPVWCFTPHFHAGRMLQWASAPIKRAQSRMSTAQNHSKLEFRTFRSNTESLHGERLHRRGGETAGVSRFYQAPRRNKRPQRFRGRRGLWTYGGDSGLSASDGSTVRETLGCRSGPVVASPVDWWIPRG